MAHGDGAAREKIRAGLPWNSSEFQLVGETSDGELALPMIYDLHPEILIADLRMPFMSGLELAMAVRRQFPWVQVILLSNSVDAGMCREQLRTFVDEHILTPLSLYELDDALHRSARRIEQLKKSLMDRIQQTKLPLTRSGAVLEVRRWIEEGAIPEDTDWPILNRFSRLVRPVRIDKDIFELAFGVLCLMEKELPGEKFAFELDGVPCIILCDADEQTLEDRSYRAAYTFCCAVEYFSGRRVCVHIGEMAESFLDLRESWRDLNLLDEEQDGSKRIYARSDAHFYCGRHLTGINAMAERMTTLDHDEVEIALNNYSRKDVMLPGIFESAVQMMLTEAGAPTDNISAGKGSFEELARMLHTAINRRTEYAPGMARMPLNSVRYYAAIYFQMPGVLRYNAAKLEGVSTHRFSVVFHQEMGISFTDYIFTMRINAAKWLLMTKMRISRIAESVGFSEQGYFESLFRRMTGMDPREYRRKFRQ